MTVRTLIKRLSELPQDAEVSIAVDDLQDRMEFKQVVCITCDGESYVLLCEEELVKS